MLVSCVDLARVVAAWVSGLSCNSRRATTAAASVNTTRGEATQFRRVRQLVTVCSGADARRVDSEGKTQRGCNVDSAKMQCDELGRCADESDGPAKDLALAFSLPRPLSWAKRQDTNALETNYSSNKPQSIAVMLPEYGSTN
jgi:hypothetical protein